MAPTEPTGTLFVTNVEEWVTLQGCDKMANGVNRAGEGVEHPRGVAGGSHSGWIAGGSQRLVRKEMSRYGKF